MNTKAWRVFHPGGKKRFVVTKELPGNRWQETLQEADCRVEICTSRDVLSFDDINTTIGNRCDGAIGQLREQWGNTLLNALHRAGGTVYSNPAVGFNNVDVSAAVRYGIPVGNTPAS